MGVIEISTLQNVFKLQPLIALKFYKKLARQLSCRLRDLSFSDDCSEEARRRRMYQMTRMISKKLKKINLDAPAEEKQEDSKQREMNKADLLFNKRFHLGGELLLQDWPVTMNKRKARVFVGQHHLCLYGRFFGSIIKKVHAYADIVGFTAEGLDFFMTVNKKSEKADESGLTQMSLTQMMLTFASQTDVSNFKTLLYQLCEKKNLSKDSIRDQASKRPEAPKNQTLPSITKRIAAGTKKSWRNDISFPSKEEWSLLFQGAEPVNLHRDDIVMQEGKSSRVWYQIVSGVLRIEKHVPSHTSGQRLKTTKLLLGYMESGETFGEITF